MTPRRMLLLVGALFAFGAIYVLYAHFFGWIDGLPLLRPEMTVASDGKFRPPRHLTSPTIELLKVAFGENSPETEPAYYPTQLRFLQGETPLVLAAGSPPSRPESKRVQLAPFSMAVFGKPRPKHLLQPGEVHEVSTVHADKAVLEFDRVIHSAAEMNSAKLVRLELISDPEQAVPDPLKRVGRVHITNNQRSADPNRYLVLKTVGPVFYRDPKVPAGAPPLTGPDIWTDAPIEIVDRGNLPRRTGPAAVAPASAEQLRSPAAVAAILAGQRLPPPTATAVGMYVYLDNEKKPAQPHQKTAKKTEGLAGLGGVRRIEFLERVVMNLWTEGGQGLVAEGKSSTALDPTAAAAAAGGLLPGSQEARNLARDLLQIETRGPFAYDAEKNIARFDVLPVSDPNLTNDVQVTKVMAKPGTQTLFSQVLELEFNGSPTGTRPAAPAQPGGPTPQSGSKFKRLHAWTYTPGRFLTVSSDADQLEAHGQDLVRETAIDRTTLTGSPLYAVQKKNVLTAGAPKQAAVLILEPPPNSTGPDRKALATVMGPGRVELYDAAANSTPVVAHWLTSMVQTRERSSGRDLDLFTFTDAAKFEDTKADFWLKGKVLKLWLGTPVPQPGVPPAPGTSREQLQRLQAIGDVSGHSADLDIEQADHMNTLFRDAAPPVAEADPVPPMSPAPPPAAAPQPKSPVAPAPPKPVKPPMKLRARTIDSWVVRQPQTRPPGAAANPEAGNDKRYQLEKSRCEGVVIVHQDPVDSTKPRGTDILGSLMLIDSSPEGKILTVFGWEDRPGEVHNEGTSLIGPKVVVDQLHNLAIVEGRGSLVMPASSDLSGTPLKKAEEIIVQFRDGMNFRGAQKVADFFGKVNASQGSSWVTCHTLQVNFDRPVYLSQANRPPTPKGTDDKAKVDVVYCYPAPADSTDGPQEKEVWYEQIDRDPATGRPVRLQRIMARELTLRAQARDPNGGEPYKLVFAEGPGEVRNWEPGTRDDDSGDPQPAPGEKKGSGQTEMKLTIVNFSGRMTAKDKGPVYKEATFIDPVEVTHVPTDNPNLKVERHRMPPRATLLTCSKELVLWSYKKATEPTQQHMRASGNAYILTEEYEGWGETITNDGKKVTFDDAAGSVPARIKGRFNGNDQSGRTIIYDRGTKHSEVQGGIGGTIMPAPRKPQPMPVPTPPKK